MKLFIDIVMKRIYLFDIVAWNYRKKIGFPVCKKENFAGLSSSAPEARKERSCQSYSASHIKWRAERSFHRPTFIRPGVNCVCLLLEFWVKCTRCERLLPVKHFYLTCLLFFRRLKITLDSEQPMLKEKRIIPSVWGGIKGFEHFLRGEYFSDCASD